MNDLGSLPGLGIPVVATPRRADAVSEDLTAVAAAWVAALTDLNRAESVVKEAEEAVGRARVRTAEITKREAALFRQLDAARRGRA